MSSYLQVLLEKSFEDIPGGSYNQYRQDVAEQVDAPYLFYEVSLMEEKPWKSLRDKVYPLFARYLKAKLIDPVDAHGVVVAVFHADRCYLLRGADFLKVFREMEELHAEALLEKVQHWLSI